MNEQVNESVVKIKIVGVGGGGKNAVERMLETNIPLVNYVTINTDDGAVKTSHAETKLQIGTRETKGYGAGANPEVGFRSAKESYNEIVNAILSLEERYRDVLTLYYLNDLSLSEIAELQGVKENTVKQQLYRGRRKLIDTIKKEVNPNEKRQSNA